MSEEQDGSGRQPERWQRVKRILADALEVSETDRVTFLDRACGDDVGLRSEVESLLAAGASEGASPTATEGDAPFASGTVKVGSYHLLQKIGEGGMGEVFLAEQTHPVRRKVALKLVKAGMDSKQVVARFEAERQALALMNHPAIARVYDAGTDDRRRPYFVMEYVQGVPITEHCDRQRLTTRERLELFILVCEGVQHAHQKAIIHRDIKPSNVLVAIQDDKAVPKIIDFGVAKATDHRLTERTLFTELGVLVGTPEYMSPEQAEMTNQDVDTRTDVYSLGVLLYELLVGALPFDSKELRQGGFDEIRRRIREEEPSKPSTRLDTLGDRSTESARRRRVDLSTLRRQLKGDLDWITIQALEKDRTRRYDSVAEMMADVRRHLADEPVLASPPSATYRAAKFWRRNRARIASATLAGVALLAIVALGLFVTQTRSERRTADLRAAYERSVVQLEQEKSWGRVVWHNVDGVAEIRPEFEELRRALLSGDLDEDLAGRLLRVLLRISYPPHSAIVGRNAPRALFVEFTTGFEGLNLFAVLNIDVLIDDRVVRTIALDEFRLNHPLVTQSDLSALANGRHFGSLRIEASIADRVSVENRFGHLDPWLEPDPGTMSEFYGNDNEPWQEFSKRVLGEVSYADVEISDTNAWSFTVVEDLPQFEPVPVRSERVDRFMRSFLVLSDVRADPTTIAYRLTVTQPLPVPLSGCFEFRLDNGLTSPKQCVAYDAGVSSRSPGNNAPGGHSFSFIEWSLIDAGNGEADLWSGTDVRRVKVVFRASPNLAAANGFGSYWDGELVFECQTDDTCEPVSID